MSKIEIIPAILPKDFAEVEEKVGLVVGLVKTVQIDVCDGQFVPNATWPYRKKDDTFEKIKHEQEGLPQWQKLDFEIDMMVNRPEEVVEEWVQTGATRIIIHIEARGDVAKAVESISGRVEVGLAINIETPIEALQPFIGQIQFVQCMGIDRIGFQGQAFDDKVLDKIKEIRVKYPEMIVSVDGGVSLERAKKLIEAGATRLVAGSAIFNSDNLVEAIEKLRNMAR